MISSRLDQLASQLDKLRGDDSEKMGLDVRSESVKLVKGRRGGLIGWFLSILGGRRRVKPVEQQKLLQEMTSLQTEISQLTTRKQLKNRSVRALSQPSLMNRASVQTFVDDARMSEAYYFDKIYQAFAEAAEQATGLANPLNKMQHLAAQKISGIPLPVAMELVPRVLQALSNDYGSQSLVATGCANFDTMAACRPGASGVAATGKVAGQATRPVWDWQGYQRMYPYHQYGNQGILFYHKGQPNYEFTNFYEPDKKLKIDGVKWPTTEHYFQASKFPQGSPHWRAVSRLATPREALNYANSRKNDWYCQPQVWGKEKQKVMLKALREKAKQDPRFRKVLLATGNQPLYEDTRTSNDSSWGIGSGTNGQNMLGFMLMQVRDELRAGRLRS